MGVTRRGGVDLGDGDARLEMLRAAVIFGTLSWSSMCCTR
jgi:hypothetical protein